MTSTCRIEVVVREKKITTICTMNYIRDGWVKELIFPVKLTKDEEAMLNNLYDRLEKENEPKG